MFTYNSNLSRVKFVLILALGNQLESFYHFGQGTILSHLGAPVLYYPNLKAINKT